MFYYRLYNILLASEVVLYDLPSVNDEPDHSPDCTVKRTVIDPQNEKYFNSKINYSYSQNSVWFANTTGHFYINNGNEILVAPRENVTDMQLSTFICGWCIAFLFAQRGFSAIHCSALEISQDTCLFISGESGAGKSTTASALISKGYRYLADDIAMVDPFSGFQIAPAFPIQKVCRNNISGLENDKLFYIDEKKDKFAYYNDDNFCSDERELTHLVLLRKGNVSAVEYRELEGINKIKAIKNCLFLAEPYRGFGIPNDEMVRILKIADKVRILLITRPTEGDTINEICNRIVDFSNSK